MYLSLTSEELRSRAQSLREILRDCVLCPRNCHVDRTRGELGKCGIADKPVVSSYGPHFGEERPLVGARGSGTVFLTGCNLGCIFCQNFEISQLRQGETTDTDKLARMMLSLQDRGCHNINLVTPTHQTPMILDALSLAIPQGLSLPIVYNCGGYEAVESIRLLDGIIDIYMPDMKYSDNSVGMRLSGVGDYWDRCREAVREMHRQVGDLRIVRAPEGYEVATRGLLVRHLVLPNGLAGTKMVMEFIANEISRDTYVNVMDQYRPCYLAVGDAEIGRPITRAEYSAAVEAARAAGLHRFDH